MKRLLHLCLAAGLLLAGCGEDSEPTRNNDFVPLTAITVTSGLSRVPAGFSTPFSATGDFSGAFSRLITTEVTWSSSNPAILTFDQPQNGLGRGGAPGTVTVTAERLGVTGTLDFTVSDASLQTIAVTPEPSVPQPVSVPQGLTRQFIATGTFSDGSTLVITPEVSWISGNPAVATVDANGLATAVETGGPVEISAGFPKETRAVTGSAQLIVTAAAVVSVNVEPADPVLTTTGTRQFTATALFSDDTIQDVTADAAWSSSDPAVATINAVTGLSTAVALGTAEITATFSGTQSSPATLTVATLEAIEVAPAANNVIRLGDPAPTLQLSAAGRFTGVAGTRDITNLVNWTSNNTDVATVSPGGLVQGIGAGTATIRATKDGRTGTALVFVQP